MRKPTKPKPGEDAEALKKEQQESNQPATPPAGEAIRSQEEQEAEALSADLEGAGDGKRMPDHDDDM